MLFTGVTPSFHHKGARVFAYANERADEQAALQRVGACTTSRTRNRSTARHHEHATAPMPTRCRSHNAGHPVRPSLPHE